MATVLGTTSTWTPLTASVGARLSYSLTTTAGAMQLLFEEVNGTIDRLSLDSGGSAPKRTLVRVWR